MSWLEPFFWAFVGAALYELAWTLARRYTKQPKRRAVIKMTGDSFDHDVMIALDGKRYIGSCTVWHEFPSGRRADTETEALLCDIWTHARWTVDS